MKERAQRQLSAILAADVAGYSRLIGLDEEGTLARLKELRRTLIDPKISENRGRIVKTMGDGLLVQFASAVDAVRCAVEVQREIAKQHGETDEDRRIEFRIGINIGDIVIDGDDIHGDGVNVAARLEALSEPGGICISHNVCEQVRDKLDLTYDDIGEQHLKNITRPVQAYQVRSEQVAAIPQPTLKLPDKPSIVVLPFVNLSGDPEQEHFSDGLTENVITDLSRFRDLFVIASNTSFSYKGKSVKVQEVGRELGVQYILEGSVQRSPNRVRITAQLIEGTSGRHLWAQRYDRPVEDIFAVQDEVTETIVGTLATAYGGRLRKAWQTRTTGSDTRNLQATDYFQRGLQSVDLFTKKNIQDGRALIGKAVELDPNYGKAYAKIAWSHMMDAYSGWSDDRDLSLAEGFRFANLAIERDDSEPWGYWALAGYHQFQRDYHHAISGFRRALELNPNDADVLNDFGLCLSYAGQAKEGLEMVFKAMRLNPHYPEWYIMQLGQIFFDARQYQDAIATFGRLRRLHTPVVELYLAASHATLGNLDQARNAINSAITLDPRASISKYTAVGLAPYKNEEDRQHFVQNLRLAGLPE